jgi:acid phosphatase type 7
MPAPASSARPYYSTAYGPVTVIVFSSEHDFSTGSPQLTWLETTLASVDRAVTPFLLFTSHRPMYIDSNFGPPPTATGDITVMNLLQQYVEPLTKKWKVDLSLYGHNHRMERISAAFGNKTVLASKPVSIDGEIVHVYDQPLATVHLVAGTAGAAFSKNDCQSVSGPCPEWSERVLFEHGYLRLTALNASALKMEYVSGLNGTVLDRSLLLKADASRPW